MGNYVNTPIYCDNCVNCRTEGDVMVGSPSKGGGPEPSFSCRKGENMTYYYLNNIRCASYDDGEFYY